MIHNAERHSSVILVVSHNKDNVEIVSLFQYCVLKMYSHSDCLMALSVCMVAGLPLRAQYARHVAMVTPRLVAPPRSAGSFTKPPPLFVPLGAIVETLL